MEIFKKIKPLSVNDAYQGRRFKTPEYKRYEAELFYTLPKIKKDELPSSPYRVYFEFGLSSSLADYDNPVKPLQDIIAKKYGFNDKLIVEGNIKKVKVEKGEEYFKFKLERNE